MRLSYEKEYRHCLENTNKRELVDKIIYDEKEFIKKDKEIARLNTIIQEIRRILKNIKPLNIKETDIKEMLKEAYKEDNIKGLEIYFKTICHLEDFEIAIWNIQDILDKRR